MVRFPGAAKIVLVIWRLRMQQAFLRVNVGAAVNVKALLVKDDANVKNLAHCSLELDIVVLWGNSSG
jgi:hypothetical protein